MKISNSKWLAGLMVVFFFMGCEKGEEVVLEEPVKTVSEVEVNEVVEVPPVVEDLGEEVVVVPEEMPPAEEVPPMEEMPPAEEVPPMEEMPPAEEVPPMEEEMMMEEAVPAEDLSEFKRDELGFNVVSEEGEVLNEAGETARTDVAPLSEEAPQQTGSLTEEDIPEKSIVLEISKVNGYVPNEFTVKKGEAITLAIKSVDEKVHIFRFKDDVLKAIAVGVAGQETRAISFNAPTEAGEYEFFSDVPGQKNKIGKMIVK